MGLAWTDPNAAVNLVEIVDSLLATGAAMSLKAQVYSGCTVEYLMKTGKHPHDAGLYEELQKVFNRYLPKDY